MIAKSRSESTSFHPFNEVLAEILVTRYRHWGEHTELFISMGFVEHGFDGQLELTDKGDQYRDNHYDYFCSDTISADEERKIDEMSDAYFTALSKENI